MYYALCKTTKSIKQVLGKLKVKLRMGTPFISIHSDIYGIFLNIWCLVQDNLYDGHYFTTPPQLQVIQKQPTTRISGQHREAQEDSGVSGDGQEPFEGQAGVEDEAVPRAVRAPATRHAHT